jgi:hypothetical protein
VPHDEYLKAHAEILGRDTWIIDGYGCLATTWERLESADTLVYLDLARAHARVVGDQAVLQGPVPDARRWPEGQPDGPQHARQLSRRLACATST